MSPSAPVRTTATLQPCGQLPDGQPVFSATLQRGALRLVVLSLGGIVSQLWVPDRHGHSANVVLGFDALHDYATRNPHFSTLVGRCCNRIAGAQFELDGQSYALPRNDGPNCLHGGPHGFGQRLWELALEEGPGELGTQLLLRLHSADGDQGFPGALDVVVRYSLPDEHSWAVDYEARSDAPTLVNLTQHAYFNLAAEGDVLDHQLRLAGSTIDATDAQLIPQSLLPVAGTPFDFRTLAAIGERLALGHPQLTQAGGFDHHWHRDAAPADEPALLAELVEPRSGRRMTLHSTAPGLQFYSGNFLDGTLPRPGGGQHAWRSGLCLEPQLPPDAIHRPDQPSPVLRPGQRWHSRSVYRFDTVAG